jgi:hypothetical protein
LTTVTIDARVRVLRAVCRAPETGDVFLGFESGEVACFRPVRGEVIYLPPLKFPVTSLATSSTGDLLAVLRMKGPTEGILSTFSGYRSLGDREFQTAGEPWLCPVLAQDGDLVAGLWNGERFQFLRGPWLLPIDRHLELPGGEADPNAVLFLPSFRDHGSRPAALALRSAHVWYFDDYWAPQEPQRKILGWSVHAGEHSTLKQPTVAWLQIGKEGLELAGIGRVGGLFCSRLKFRGRELTDVLTHGLACQHPGLAVTVIRLGLVAVVNRTGVNLLRCGAGGFTSAGTMEVPLPSAIACFFHPWTSELLVVSSDGTVTRVPLRARLPG